jgi:hypothetical protein
MAGEALFFAKELEFIRQEVYRREYPTLKATKHFPVYTDAGRGAKVITHTMTDRIGSAAIGMGFPLIEIKRREFSTPVRELTASYKWDINELWYAQRAGVNLRAEKAFAAADAIARLEDELAYLGDEETGLLGAFTHPNVPIQVADFRIDNSSTPDQIIGVYNSAINLVGTLTRNVRMANYCLSSVKAFSHISTTRIPDTSDTILEFLKKAHPQVTFDWCTRCSGAGIGGTDVIFTYERDPSVIRLNIPLPFEQLPEHWTGKGVEINCIEQFGGIEYIYVAAVLTIGV